MKSCEKSMKSCEKSMKSREKSRKSIENSLKIIEKSMKSDEKSMKSCEKSRKSYEKSMKIDEKSNNEILKLKELPNERLEGSWGALWLGIRTFFGFKLGVVGLQGQSRNPKIERATE